MDDNKLKETVKQHWEEWLKDMWVWEDTDWRGGVDEDEIYLYILWPDGPGLIPALWDKKVEAWALGKLAIMYLALPAARNILLERGEDPWQHYRVRTLLEAIKEDKDKCPPTQKVGLRI